MKPEGKEDMCVYVCMYVCMYSCPVVIYDALSEMIYIRACDHYPH